MTITKGTNLFKVRYPVFVRRPDIEERSKTVFDFSKSQKIGSVL